MFDFNTGVKEEAVLKVEEVEQKVQVPSAADSELSQASPSDKVLPLGPESELKIEG